MKYTEIYLIKLKLSKQFYFLSNIYIDNQNA